MSFLEEQGYRILAHSFFTRHGEIDIVAEKENTVAFVEVKYRKDEKSGLPEEAVSTAKMQKICKAADYYLYTHKGLSKHQIRFDVIGILGDEIRFYENAFPYVN